MLTFLNGSINTSLLQYCQLIAVLPTHCSITSLLQHCQRITVLLTHCSIVNTLKYCQFIIEPNFRSFYILIEGWSVCVRFKGWPCILQEIGADQVSCKGLSKHRKIHTQVIATHTINNFELNIRISGFINIYIDYTQPSLS